MFDNAVKIGIAALYISVICILLPNQQVLAGVKESDSERKCSDIRNQLEEQAASLGWPQVVAASGIEPTIDDSQMQTQKFGLTWSLGDLSRRLALSQRAEAECDYIEKNVVLNNVTTNEWALAEFTGHKARQDALVRSLAEAEHTLAEKKKRLIVHAETRESVNRSARNVAAIRQMILDGAEVLDAGASGIKPAFKEDDGEAGSEIVRADSDLRQAAATLAHRRAVDRTGPAWDLILNGGYERRFAGLTADTGQGGGQRPYYASVEFRWKLGHLIAASQESMELANIGQPGVDSSEYLQRRKLRIETLQKKVAAHKARAEEIRSDLATIAGLADGNALAESLTSELTMLEVELADWQGQLSVFGRFAMKSAEPSASPPRKEFEKSRSLILETTQGALDRIGSGFYRTSGTAIRANALSSKGVNGVQARIRYKGLTDEVKAMGSGADRRQLGLFLASTNQCNRLYVMWRAGADEANGSIVVQKKVNPGSESHGDCENRGYVTIAPAKSTPVTLPTDGREFRLAATIDQGNLLVFVDGQNVWAGPVDLSDLDGRAGYAGFRSDNVILDIALEATR